MHPHLLKTVFVGLLSAAAGCNLVPERMPASPTSPQPATPAGLAVSGTVSDSAWRPLAGARVEVVEGSGAGQSVIADPAGLFGIRGPFDETTRFRATKDGHAEATWPLPSRCAACNPNWWIHFYLEVAGPRVTIAGNYDLTFIASDECTALPAELRTRTYRASATPVVSPDGAARSQFNVAVSGLAVGYDGFVIGIAGDYLAAATGHDEPYLVEQVAPTTYLGFDGFATASVGSSAAVITARFDGAIAYCDRKSPLGPRWSCTPAEAISAVRCLSKTHRMVLTRR